MSLIWLYAVTRDRPGAIAGLDGAAVRGIEEGGLVAVVSDVEDAYEKVDDLVRDGDWLTPRATAHQAVNAAVHAAADAVLPVPFATIYRGEERVREMLRSRAEELRARLESVKGRAEWVVAVHRDTVQAAAHLSEVRHAVEPVAAGAGRRYLEERKSDSERRAELRRLDTEAAASARHAMERVSRQAFEEPIADDASDIVARTTYLVRRTDEHRMEDAMRTFNDDWRTRGYDLRATGPWPPYRSAA